MDNGSVYASMLSNAGIAVSSEELAAMVSDGHHAGSGEPDVGDAIVQAPYQYPFWEEPKYLPSFTHLTHLQADRGFVPYRRKTHFQHLLEQVQGCIDSSPIARKTLTTLRRARVNPKKPYAYHRSRLILKRKGMGSAAYRCIFWALKTMGGPVLKLKPAEETALKKDFDELCECFERSEGQRKNFLSYYVVLQLLLSKWKIPCFYKLPTVKDTKKFNRVLDMYRSMRILSR